MPCYSPLSAWRGGVQASGKRAIVWNARESALPNGFALPCGQCIGCRLERSRQWAMRCLHEASLYEENCFLTLTYDDEHLPVDGSLVKEDFQLFMKRLRKRFEGRKVRYFHCGEYGEECRDCFKSRRLCVCRVFNEGIGRPHYHAIMFNVNFLDRFLHTTRNGFKLDRSETLETIWDKGNSLIGDVTFESAAYVARYVMKKVSGEKVDELEGVFGLRHYEKFSRLTGEVKEVLPEYVTMSRGGRGEGLGGIGKGWFNRYKGDVYPGDFVVVRGLRMKPPRFYDGLMEALDPLEFERIKGLRVLNGLKHADDNTMFRLRVKEEVKKASIKTLRRGLEAVI